MINFHPLVSTMTLNRISRSMFLSLQSSVTVLEHENMHRVCTLAHPRAVATSAGETWCSRMRGDMLYAVRLRTDAP